MARSLPRRQETGGLKDKKELSRKKYQRLLNKFEVGGFMAREALWNLARENMLQDRGALLEEECDVIGAYTAML